MTEPAGRACPACGAAKSPQPMRSSAGRQYTIWVCKPCQSARAKSSPLRAPVAQRLGPAYWKRLTLSPREGNFGA